MHGEVFSQMQISESHKKSSNEVIRPLFDFPREEVILHGWTHPINSTVWYEHFVTKAVGIADISAEHAQTVAISRTLPSQSNEK